MQEKRVSFVPPDMDTLKGYMKDFNIGHESFLTLCLYNPELAKFGIDIDASRPRYHLLVNDLCEIALINEDVSKHILNNTRLQSSNRLQGGFASVIAEHYPHLLADLFSAIPSVGRVCLPQPEEMVHAISKNPWLFVKLLENKKFLNLINNAEIINELALIEEDIALWFFKNSNKFKHFDKDLFIASVAEKYEYLAMKILKNSNYRNYLEDFHFLSIGKKHVMAAQFIIANFPVSSQFQLNNWNKVKEMAAGIFIFLMGRSDINSTMHVLPKELIGQIVTNYSEITNSDTFFASNKQRKSIFSEKSAEINMSFNKCQPLLR